MKIAFLILITVAALSAHMLTGAVAEMTEGAALDLAATIAGEF